MGITHPHHMMGTIDVVIIIITWLERSFVHLYEHLGQVFLAAQYLEKSRWNRRMTTIVGSPMHDTLKYGRVWSHP